MFFFFFQAEDGIRDVAVTGVQTCALPISSSAPFSVSSRRSWRNAALIPRPRPSKEATVRFKGIFGVAGLTGGTAESTIRMLVDRKSTRLNSSHGYISYAVFCLKKKKKTNTVRLTSEPGCRDR